MPDRLSRLYRLRHPASPRAQAECVVWAALGPTEWRIAVRSISRSWSKPQWREFSVFSHIFVGVSDFERALRFYNPLMLALGVKARFCERERPWAG